mmetsp:Transcript_35461/g.52808  ORF Transcript_35461/g.52808 Transcript_35461/m.52808 type:complete len:82 (+) Transcript_35461:133-378(+)
MSPELQLERAPAILVNAEVPMGAPLLLHELRLRADRDTRVHCLFSKSLPNSVVLPIMGLAEEAGHEVPPDLEAHWCFGLDS